MHRKQFTFYRSYRDALIKVSKKDRLAIYDALIDFALDGYMDAELTEKQQTYFELILPSLTTGRSKAFASLVGKGYRPDEED